MKETFKRDTEENWKKAANFIPKAGEIIIYDCADGPRMKIGDGINKVNDLSFKDTSIVSSKGKVEDTILILD